MAEAATQERTDTAQAQMSDGSTAGKELTVQNSGAPPAEGPKTEAQRKKEKLQKVLAELSARAENYQPLLQAHGIDWGVFVAVLQQAFVKVPALLDCTTASILQAAFLCAKDGLMPDGDEAAITPFKKTATYVPGYKGLLKCAYAMVDGRGEKVYRDVDVDVVYEGEEAYFEYRKGTDPMLSFSPPLKRDIGKAVVAAYAVIRTNNGGIFVEVISQAELAKIAQVNKASNGPRAQWGAEMHKKGPLRRLLKRTPKDQRLVQLMQHDEDAYLPHAAAVVDGDATEIPDDKLFDDKVHDAQIEDVTGDAAAGADERTDDDNGNPHMAEARADLMAAETEAQLDAVITKIKASTNSGRKKSGAFSAEEGEELLANAEQLRAHRWPKEGDTSSPPASAEAAEPEAETQDSSPSQKPSDTSTTANTAEPDGGATSASPSKPDNVKAMQEYEEAPASDRLSPQEALLEDVGTVFFLAGIKPNGNGQCPMFRSIDGALKIVGWAKPDLDIPTKSPAETNAVIDDSAKPAPEPAAAPPAAEEAPAAEPATEDEDDGYGEDTVVYRLRVKPGDVEGAVKEYTDPVEWRDAVIFKMGSLNANAGPKWWGDNQQYVVDALPTAKAAAGRILVTAAAKKYPGAQALVDQHGPF